MLALVRPLTLLWLPIVVYVLHRVVRSWRKALVGAGIVTVAAAGVILPWVVRNSVTFGTVVGISTNSGDDLCIGNNPHATGAYDFVPGCYPDEAVRIGEPQHDSRDRRRAFDYAIHHPQREVELLFSKTYYTLRDDHDALSVMGTYLPRRGRAPSHVPARVGRRRRRLVLGDDLARPPRGHAAPT